MRNCLFILFLIPMISFSQYGVLDETFGEGGLSINQIPDDIGNYFTPTAMISDQSQNIYVVGNFGSDYLNQNQFFIAKFFSDGSLDTAFGFEGYKKIELNEEVIIGNDIILTNDNMLAIVGNYRSSEEQNASGVFVMKIDLNGNLINSFGESGFYFSDFSDSAKGLVLDQDVYGNYYVGAESGVFGSDYLITKINELGMLDITFGLNGKIIKDVGSEDFPTQMTIINDFIYLLGISTMFEPSSLLDHDICLLKYTLSGEPVSSFGENGMVLTSYENTDIDAFSMDFGVNNEIYIGGSLLTEESNENLYIINYHGDGFVDDTFGENGISQYDIGGIEYPTVGIHVMDVDNIILTGNSYSLDEEGFQFAFVSSDSNGELNQNVGNEGIVITDLIEGLQDRVYKSIKHTNDKIILMGKSGVSNLSLARYYVGEGLNVSDVSNYKNIQIAPNPTSNSFIISGLKGSEVEIQIFDLSGKLIRKFEKMHDKQKIDLDPISKGTYLIKIKSGNWDDPKKLIVK